MSRTVKVSDAEPLEVGLPQVRSLAVVEKTSTTKSAAAQPAESIAYYLSEQPPSSLR